MSTSRHIEKICAAAAAVALILTVILMNHYIFGICEASKVMGYESRLFDTSKVHTINIEMMDWESFIATCENEEYAVCNVEIDGESYHNVGIRAKGNTSLSSVSSMGSDRYSFKIEFDQYDNGITYHGLDKLSLNNLIQDNTMMKDYLTYQMMGEFGAAAPLCSYVYITVNGEDWGLYLAVEGVEDSFLERNYGKDHGGLYKPDSMNMGGGRGNGRDFDMEEWQENMPEGFDAFEATPPQAPQGGASSPASGGARPGGFPGDGMPGGFGGMGASDVKLQYIDDDPDSYPNIFNSAKTDVTAKDQARLIQALKRLSEGTDIASTVDAESVIRYFVVHNFVCNGDSYTGAMIHNYYLYEEEGQLAMLPWDYNLAYGSFQGSSATSTVNSPIDTPVSGGMDDRPMIRWIFESEEYTELYHQYFEEFLEAVDFEALITGARDLIAPYVEKDPGKFCTYEEFTQGVDVILAFCQLRAESVAGQLAGTIPADTAGQQADSSTLVDASHLDLSDMGSMGMGGGFPGGGQRPEGHMQMPDGFQIPEGMDPGSMQMPEGFTPPDGMEMPEGGFPGGFNF
ncbi:MAG: CotH kinase family protein [Firmicutes bacterium]|nr:CotH kinase family protein [Bacillota bacterium]